MDPKKKEENTVLTNFRLELATSSQMVNYSHHKAGSAASTVYGKRSRMGLQLANNVGEYIVGGWCIGNVMDTAASRGSFPNEASSIGVRTAPNSAALSINVNIDWWDGDRIWRTFSNKENKTATRFEPPKGPPKMAINRTGEKATVDAAAGAGFERTKGRLSGQAGNGTLLFFLSDWVGAW